MADSATTPSKRKDEDSNEAGKPPKKKPKGAKSVGADSSSFI